MVNTCTPWCVHHNRHPVASLPSLCTLPLVHKKAGMWTSLWLYQSGVSSREVVNRWRKWQTSSWRCEPRSAAKLSRTPPCGKLRVWAANQWRTNYRVFRNYYQSHISRIPHSKVHGANMGPIWGRQDPGGSHVGHRDLAIWDRIMSLYISLKEKRLAAPDYQFWTQKLR